MLNVTLDVFGIEDMNYRSEAGMVLIKLSNETPEVVWAGNNEYPMLCTMYSWFDYLLHLSGCHPTCLN